jgi:hypothetical protein
MKHIFKLLFILALGYTLFVQGFKTLFEFFNKSKYTDFWLTFFRSDVPNIIVLGVLIYLIVKLIKDLRTDVITSGGKK